MQPDVKFDRNADEWEEALAWAKTRRLRSVMAFRPEDSKSIGATQKISKAILQVRR